MKQQRGLKAAFSNLKWWQVGVLSVAVSVIGGLSGGTFTTDTKIYTRKLKQAPWAPPSWLFAPAWTAINFSLLLGLQQIIKDKKVSERNRLLALQMLMWLIFFSFNYVYFRKKSTVLAATWTVTDMIAAYSSIIIAAKSNPKVAASLIPLTVWTSFASSIAVYQALYNKDELLQTPALLK